MRKFILEGNFCRFDCEGCTESPNYCSMCNILGKVTLNNNSCECLSNYVPISIIPLICAKQGTN